MNRSEIHAKIALFISDHETSGTSRTAIMVLTESRLNVYKCILSSIGQRSYGGMHSPLETTWLHFQCQPLAGPDQLYD